MVDLAQFCSTTQGKAIGTAVAVVVLFLVLRSNGGSDPPPKSPVVEEFVLKHEASSRRDPYFPEYLHTEQNGRLASLINTAEWKDIQQYLASYAYTEEKVLEMRQFFSISIPSTLEEVRLHNEQTRQSVSNWIARVDWELVKDGGRSEYGYGLPGFVYPVINLNVGGYPLQHDLVSYVATQMATKITYAEVGVSVCKNIYTQMRFLGPQSSVTAVDIENINPTFERLLVPNMELLHDADESFSPEVTGIAEKFTISKTGMQGSIKRLRLRDGQHAPLSYIRGDEFATETWNAIKEEQKVTGKWNLVLSDAFHTSTAIQHEIEMLIKYDLLDLDNHFAIIWDDCDGDMAAHFWNVLRPMLEKYSSHFEFQRYKVYGWLGVHEKGGVMHGTCVALSRRGSQSLLANAWELDATVKLGILLQPEGSTD